MAVELAPPEHLTPHDLVAYFRCPYEMELRHREHRRETSEPSGASRSTIALRTQRHSPLLPPPSDGLTVVEGRLDLDDRDTLVYADEESGLPVLFPPERVHLDIRFTTHPRNLRDEQFGLSGRPDFVVQRAGGELYPIEYKATHLFMGLHAVHGRAFDTLQAIAECRLVEAAFGRRPPFGIVLYGDALGEGRHEGYVEVRYSERESNWLAYALAVIRADHERAPVPSDHNCPHCAANQLGLCDYAVARYEGGHPPSESPAGPPLRR